MDQPDQLAVCSLVTGQDAQQTIASPVGTHQWPNIFLSSSGLPHLNPKFEVDNYGVKLKRGANIDYVRPQLIGQFL